LEIIELDSGKMGRCLGSFGLSREDAQNSKKWRMKIRQVYPQNGTSYCLNGVMCAQYEPTIKCSTLTWKY